MSIWLKHNVDTRLNFDMATFLSQYGAEGYGLYWILLETLALSSSYTLEKSERTWQSLAICTKCQKAKEIIECLIDLGIFQCDENSFWCQWLTDDFQHLNDKLVHLQNKRKEFGRLGGLAKASKTKQSLAKPSKTYIREDKIREDKIRINIDRSLAKDNQENNLTKYGQEFLSMTESEMGKIIEKFGQALVDQELPEADIWIANSQTASGRKYREPNFNHYLFFRTTWLKDKRLAPTKGFSNGTNNFDKNIQERERLLKLEAEGRL